MHSVSALIERDLKHVWHPCSQMKDYETFLPLEIMGASGSYLHLKEGRKILDAISSWWCKSLGHQHPRLKKALLRQLDQFEHVILANTTNETIVALSEKLAALAPPLDKVFYASDGSSAIEIALKMSVHARKILGEKRTHFLSLENSFHGETAGALSVSDLGLYRDAYEPLLFTSKFISSIPYVQSTEDPLWRDCELHWQKIERDIAPYSETATALIVEPILQGTGGMKMYSQDFLRRLREWTNAHGIHLIADEIMTSIGRTGKMLACEHANITPDFVCVSKGLTAGWLPLSAVMTSNAIYDLFYDDYAAGKSFLHSHTFSGNPLAASIALEVLRIMEEEQLCERAMQIGAVMRNYMHNISDNTKKITNIRGIGGVIAADLIVDASNKRVGYEVYRRATELGALLRPLGNTIYWLPPLTISMDELAKLHAITEQAILQVVSF